MTNEHDYSSFIGHNSKAELPEVVKLAEAQHAAEVKVAKTEEELKVQKEEVKQIAEYKLPQLMEDLGISTYTTQTGIGVEIKEKIRGSLPVENRPKGYTWLEEKGFGGMIESEIKIGFPLSKLKNAQALVDELRKRGFAAVLERNVHHARLDAFIREQLSQGKDIPLDIFGVFRQRIAKVEIED